MATKVSLRHQEFWMKVYVAAIRKGYSSLTATTLADEAVVAFEERE